MSYLDKNGLTRYTNNVKQYVENNKPVLSSFTAGIGLETPVGKSSTPTSLEFSRTFAIGNGSKLFTWDNSAYNAYVIRNTSGTTLPVKIDFQVYAYKGYTAGAKLYVNLTKTHQNGLVFGTVKLSGIKWIYYIPIANPYMTFVGSYTTELESNYCIGLNVYTGDGKGSIGFGDNYDTYLSLTTIG